VKNGFNAPTGALDVGSAANVTGNPLDGQLFKQRVPVSAEHTYVFATCAKLFDNVQAKKSAAAGDESGHG
jgi:hypothetical protein